jgi:UDP-N-acetylglucosamine--N-acetylmuramyl-(pentapeptide) pyrophosphoryl-undecaprenol N-acetylglucosamine transferase
LTEWDAERGRQVLGLSPDLPVLLVFGGSKGARTLNRSLLAALPELLRLCQVLHIAGQLDWPEVQAAQASLLAELPTIEGQRYHAYPYLHAEMGAALASANLAICRAGASTLGELPLFGLPAVLVPYPFAWRYQQVNAQYLADQGAGVIISDAELSDKLLPTVKRLLHSPKKLAQMQKAMSALAQPDAAQKIALQALALAGSLRGAS